MLFSKHNLESERTFETPCRGKIYSVDIKREVERGYTFTLVSDLSYITSILFANVNFRHLRT